MLGIPWNEVKMLLEIPWEGSKKWGSSTGGCGYKLELPIVQVNSNCDHAPPLVHHRDLIFWGGGIVKFPTVW